jgi:hypothetical protein
MQMLKLFFPVTGLIIVAPPVGLISRQRNALATGG